MNKAIITIFVILLVSCVSQQHTSNSKRIPVQPSYIIEKIVSNNNLKDKSSFSGQVVDAVTNEGLSNATVLFSDNIFKSGTECDLNGNFEVKATKEGYYKVQVSFVGYNTFTIDSLFLEKGTNTFIKIAMTDVIL